MNGKQNWATSAFIHVPAAVSSVFSMKSFMFLNMFWVLDFYSIERNNELLIWKN